MGNFTGKKNVLVVEDDLELQSLMREALLLSGYSCECTSEFFEAQCLIHKKKYNFYILDIRLGGHSGLDLIPLIDLDDATKVVVASGNLDDAIQKSYPQVWKFCQKPFNFFKLIQEMESTSD